MKIMEIPPLLLDQLSTLDGTDWPEPEPLSFKLLAVKPFSDSLLPTELLPFVSDVAERMQCPPDFVAIPAVVMLGALIGNGCCVRPKQHDDWSEFPNIWGGIIGRPGRLKSPAMKAGLEPMRWLEGEAQLAFEAAQQAHARALVEREMEIQLLKSTKPNKRSCDQQNRLTDLLMNEPAEPTLLRYSTNDATIEKLALLMNENPRGLLVMRDELVGLLANCEKQGHEGDRTFYLEAWAGNSRYAVDRVGRGTTIVEHLTLSLFGGIQPAKLQRYLYETQYGLGNDGLLQRFQLVVYPDDEPAWRIVDRAPDRKALDNLIALCMKIAEGNFDTLGAQRDEHRPTPFFRFSPEGQEVFNAWFLDLGRKVAAEEHPIIAEHLGKYRKLVPALSLIFHLVALISGGVQIGSSITVEALRRALAWARYLESHSRRIYNMALDVHQDAVQALAAKLKSGELENGFTERDAYRKGWANLTEPEIVGAACRELEQAGWLRRMPQERAGGRPTVRYEINPAVTV